MIRELCEGLVRRCLIAHYPEHAKHSDESKDVKDHHNALEGWKFSQ